MQLHIVVYNPCWPTSNLYRRRHLLDNGPKSSSFGFSPHQTQLRMVKFGRHQSSLAGPGAHLHTQHQHHRQPSTIRIDPPIVNPAIRRCIDVQPNPIFIICRSGIHVNLGSSHSLEVNTRWWVSVEARQSSYSSHTTYAQKRGIKEEEQGNEAESDGGLHKTWQKVGMYVIILDVDPPCANPC